jgi:predicted RNA-binding protein YlqC (UPF0109 family)
VFDLGKVIGKKGKNVLVKASEIMFDIARVNISVEKMSIGLD